MRLGTTRSAPKRRASASTISRMSSNDRKTPMTQELALGTAQPFGIGRVLSTRLAVFGRNVGAFLGATFGISVAYIVLQTWIDYQTTHGSVDHSFQGGIGIVQTITFTLVQAALTYGVLQDLRGGRPTISDCFHKGLKSSSR